MKKYSCNYVQFLREKYGLSRSELALLCDCSRETIRLIENSEQVPSLDLAFRIAFVFDVKVENLFGHMYDFSCSKTHYRLTRFLEGYYV